MTLETAQRCSTLRVRFGSGQGLAVTRPLGSSEKPPRLRGGGVTRIEVQRTGGFAGVARRAEVDTSARPDADEWHALAQQAVATGRDAPPVGVPDGFHYRITVDDRTVHCADPHLSEAQRALVSRVLKEGA